MSSASSEFSLEHQILVLDAYLTAPLDSESRDSITEQFVESFLSTLGLEPLGPLGIYPAVDERAPGWSFIQAITTSHISAHYFERPGLFPHVRIDAYSCKAIAWRELIRVCDRHFRLAQWRATFIHRDMESPNERVVLDISGEGSSVTATRPLTTRNASDKATVAA